MRALSADVGRPLGAAVHRNDDNSDKQEGHDHEPDDNWEVDLPARSTATTTLSTAASGTLETPAANGVDRRGAPIVGLVCPTGATRILVVVEPFGKTIWTTRRTRSPGNTVSLSHLGRYLVKVAEGSAA